MQDLDKTQEQLTKMIIENVVKAQMKLTTDVNKLVEDLNDIFEVMFRFEVKAFDNTDEGIISMNVLYNDPITEKDKVITFNW